jgi:predicted AAA+ superfamily ATPase
MTDEILKALLDWNPWLEGEFPKELGGYPRQYDLAPYLQIHEIKILEGARRVGKSTMLYQIIRKLIHEKRKVLYINFEDEILRKYTLGQIVGAYQQKDLVQCLFVDEIQNCTNWVAYIRKVHDRKEIPQIWISGSNSSFIKNEFATLLTGRNMTIKVFPLSFEEYLNFKSINETKLPFSSKKEAVIKNQFEQYLNMGAFPAVVLRSVLQKELLINYFEDFLYKDIASRHDVNLVKIKELGLYLATNSAKSFSYRGCASALGMHPKTIMDYCSYFFEIFLFKELYKFDYSLKNQIGNDKKIYIADTGLANAISFRFSEDQGRMLENLVHNELKRRSEEIYFHKHKFECDFIIKKELKIAQAIQVTKNLNDPDVKKREFRGLVEAMHIHELNEGLILTMEEEGVEEVYEDNRSLRIQILPVWKWLLI